MHALLLFRNDIERLLSPYFLGAALLGLVFWTMFGGLVFADRIKTSPLKSKLIHRITISPANTSKVKSIILFFCVLVILAGLIIRVAVIVTVPPDAPIADMLPLINAASLALHAGQNPYQVYYVPHPLPLTFLPGLWLPYYPLIVLGLDPRWLGLLIWLVISAVLVMLLAQSSQKEPSPFLFCLGAINHSLLQFSPEFFLFHAFGHTFPLWGWLALTCFGIIQKNDWITALGLGLVLASRQTTLVLIPILAVYWVRAHGLGGALRFFGVTLGVFLVLTLPFAVQSPAQMFLTPIEHYQSLAAVDFNLGPQSYMTYSIGFAYILQKLAGVSSLTFLNGLVLLVVSLMSFYLSKNRQRVLIGMAAGLVWFNLFTPIPWSYVYYPELIILSFALLL